MFLHILILTIFILIRGVNPMSCGCAKPRERVRVRRNKHDRFVCGCSKYNEERDENDGYFFTIHNNLIALRKVTGIPSNPLKGALKIRVLDVSIVGRRSCFYMCR